MDAATYAVEAKVEQHHWWFVARRRLFSRMVQERLASREAHVLDVGTSTGANLRMLSDLGYRKVTGLDLSEIAIEICNAKGLGPVQKGDVCDLPFPDDAFDCVMATDIIEHVDMDTRALSEIARVLKPGGYALVTVPAFPMLWGLQDEVAKHKRRYRLNGIVAQVQNEGLEIVERFYFNYILFIPILLVRRLMRFAQVRLASENQINTRLLNNILTHVFTFDVMTARRLSPPVGVSAFVLARKPS